MTDHLPPGPELDRLREALRALADAERSKRRAHTGAVLDRAAEMIEEQAATLARLTPRTVATEAPPGWGARLIVWTHGCSFPMFATAAGEDWSTGAHLYRRDPRDRWCYCPGEG